MMRPALIAPLFLLAGGLCLAQSPVPEGQATLQAQVHGIVQSSTGELRSNVQITASSRNGPRTLSTQTNSEGRFDLTLPPGRYSVTAVDPGFGKATSTIDVLPGQSTTIRLMLGGPVPSGEAARATPHAPISPTQLVATGSPGDVPIPSGGSVSVGGQFRDWTGLAHWLNDQSARNLRLQAILTTAAYKNLFVWAAPPGAAQHGDQHLVLPANQIAAPADLQNVLSAYPQATVIGLAWINHDRYLILRSNP